VGGSGEYFIGSVDASEFATFELTASVDSGVSSIPVEVSYIVDGERIRTTQLIEITSTNVSMNQGDSSRPTPGSSGGQGSSGIPLVPIVIVLFVVAIGGGLYYVWNRE
jgi:hypothetical protein